MGIQPLAGPFPLTRPSELQHLAVWRQPLPATSSPRRPQPRPRPRGKAPVGMSLGRRPGMSGPSPRSLPLGGAVPPEARKVWARLARVRGPAGSCPWPVGPLSTTGPLPLEDLPGCLQRPLCKHSRRLFPPAAQNAPKSGRKALRGGALSRPLPLSLRARQGSTLPGQGRTTCTRLFLPPTPAESSGEPESVRQLLGWLPVWEGAEPT